MKTDKKLKAMTFEAAMALIPQEERNVLTQVQQHAKAKEIMKNDLKERREKQQLALEAVSVHAKKIQLIGNEILKATAVAGNLYLDLCTYIRKNNISPKMVSHELGELGFSRSRISEINTTAQASEATFSAFAARTIGMRKVLELERGNVIDVLASVSGDTVETVKSQVAESSPVAGTTGACRVASGDPVEAQTRKLEKMMHALIELAESMKLRKRQATSNGYMVTISKVKGYKAPTPAATGEAAPEDKEDTE